MLHLVSKPSIMWYLSNEFCHLYISIEMVKSNTVIFSYCNRLPDTLHSSCAVDNHEPLIFRAILRCCIVEFNGLWILLLSTAMLKYPSCHPSPHYIFWQFTYKICCGLPKEIYQKNHLYISIEMFKFNTVIFSSGTS